MRPIYRKPRASGSILAKPRLQSVKPAYLAASYFGWLLVLPVAGALAAGWSRRAGGSIATRIVASLFFAGAMVATLLVIMVAWILQEVASSRPCLSRRSSLAAGAVRVMVLPAAALLAGAAPFLRDKPTSQGSFGRP